MIIGVRADGNVDSAVDPESGWSPVDTIFAESTCRKQDRVACGALTHALRPGGIAIIATFADDGPEMCSGLPVARHYSEELAQELNRLHPGRLEMLAARRHMHVTPKGSRQSFHYSVFRKTDR